MALGDTLRFMKAAGRNPGAVGAVLPSSRALANQMVRGIDFTDGHDVIELGPGTGPFTAALQRHMPDPSRYLGIDLNPEFIALLQGRFPAMQFVAGSAAEADQLAASAGLHQVRTILSGLPFASLPVSVQDGVIEALDRLLQPGVIFRTFQYVHAMPLGSARRFRRLMHERFGHCRISRPVMLNIPPAVVLSWSR